VYVRFLQVAQIRGTRYAPGDVEDIDTDIAVDFIARKVAVFAGDGDRHSHTWTDLVQGAVGVNPPGLVSDPSVDTTLTDFPGTYLFAGNAVNILAGSWQVIHEWAEGTALRPHIHWMLTANSADAVDWGFYWRVSGPGLLASAWSSEVSGTLKVGHGGVADTEAVTTFGEIDLTGYKVSCNVAWRLYRNGDTDANNDDARLLSIDAHYRKDGTGSKQEYVKG